MFSAFKKKLKQVFRKTKQELEKPAEKVVEVKPKEKEEVKKEKEEKKKELIEEKKEEEKEEKREGIFAKIKKVVRARRLTEDEFNKFFNALEPILIENNVAMEAIDFLKESLKKDLLGKEIKKANIEEEIKQSLKKAVSEMLIQPFSILDKIKDKIKNEKPYTIVFFGINGSGKTTTIAKIVHLLKENNLTSVLAASDTFRAASIEQLEKHGTKLGVKVIKHKYGADPAAVAFDANAHAKAKGIDVVLIDTAGRIHTKQDLLNEMKKICRVAKPDLKVFVAESIVGNDAVEQAKAFNDAIGIDAIILTKADVDEKGGATISVSYVTKKPILYLGVGQEYGDLKPFNKQEIIKSIFGE